MSCVASKGSVIVKKKPSAKCPDNKSKPAENPRTMRDQERNQGGPGCPWLPDCETIFCETTYKP